MTDIQRGCLVLADITGYTRYLGGVELDHSHDVIADLLGVVVAELAAVGSLAKLEGDAVFVCDRDGHTDGETLLAALDAAYFAFARRQRTIAVRSSCTCEACARIPSLDLKLIAHHGSFVQHVVAGSSELVGPDVVVVHRLLKNRASDRAGVSAFALITDVCLGSLGLDPHALDLIAHEEHYEDVGAVSGWIRNLETRWQQAEQRQAIRITARDADVSVSAVCPGSPAQVWDSVVAPDRILGWKVGATEIEMQNPSGGRGVGSRTHCVHGRQAFDQEILDWRPFDYFSYRETGPYGPFVWTIELVGEPESIATHVAVHVKQLGGRRQRVVMRLGRRRFTRALNTSLGNLADLLST